MSASTDDGGPAFPVQPANWKDDAGRDCVAFGSEGMSLRDWFATSALNGLLSDSTSSLGVESAAQWSYKYADAMLAERARKGEQP